MNHFVLFTSKPIFFPPQKKNENKNDLLLLLSQFAQMNCLAALTGVAALKNLSSRSVVLMWRQFDGDDVTTTTAFAAAVRKH